VISRCRDGAIPTPVTEPYHIRVTSIRVAQIGAHLVESREDVQLIADWWRASGAGAGTFGQQWMARSQAFQPSG